MSVHGNPGGSPRTHSTMDTVKAIAGALTGALLLALAMQLIGAMGEEDADNATEAPAATTSVSAPTAGTAAEAEPQPASVQASQPAPQQQPRPEAPAPQPQPPLAPVISHELYVASQDAEVVHFVVERASRVKMRLVIEGDVPVDVVATQGKVSREQWMMAAAVGETLSILTVFSDDQAQPDMFAAPLSKKAAFRVFESPWVAAQPGEYTIVLDNTKVYTPSRGDAIVKLELYSAQ